MSKWKQFFITLKSKAVLVLLILSFMFLSSVMTYLITRYYDYRLEISKQEKKITLLETTVCSLQQSLGGNMSTLKAQISTPILYEAEPLKVPETPMETPDDRNRLSYRKGSKKPE